MQNKLTTACMMALAIGIGTSMQSCKEEKKEPTTYVTQIKEDKPVNKKPHAIGNFSDTTNKEWGNDMAQVTIVCSSDTSGVITDDEGQRYYDNVIKLNIELGGKDVYHHAFTKEDFSKYINTNYLKPNHSSLLSIAFTDIVNNKACFVASVGSPDKMSDVFMLFDLKISKDGSMSISVKNEEDV